MKYPVAVWECPEGGFSAEVPDLPGAITEADSMPELLDNINEAASGWMEVALDHNEPIPAPSSVSELHKRPEYADSFWLMADIDPDSLSDKVERINICLPSRALRRLDRLAQESGDTRSGFLAKTIYSLSA